MLGASAVCAREDVPAPPAFAELEASGATIGEVRILNRNIFDTEDPKEDKWLFVLANALHIQTREGVIRRTLLFKSGDKLSANLIEETERLLRSVRYLYDVQIRPVAVHDGVVDIEVLTRDTWTLDPSFSAGRSGGANSSSIRLNEYNLLGTGVSLSYGRVNTVDRSSNEFQFANDRAFGGWTSIRYSHQRNSDGKRDALSVAQPFYSLDTPWAVNFAASKDNRIDSIYSGGTIASQYRHREDRADVWGGWSTGRVDGWVQRYSLGAQYSTDAFAVEPGLVAPPALPLDEKLVAPFVRYELIEDRFERLRNRDQIERPEFFAMGWASTLQLGYAAPQFGSTRNAWLYSASASRGFTPFPEHTLLASMALNGEFSASQVRRQRLGSEVNYYLPQNPHWLFYASATADMLTRPDLGDELLLGGDSGLRGFPLRYQIGTRRALFVFEERAYTDLFVWQLFRIGAAVFVDVGRAWGGTTPNVGKTGWLSDVGLGLRIFSVRSAFSNVLHLDLAFPNDPDTNVKKTQFLIKTRASF